MAVELCLINGYKPTENKENLLLEYSEILKIIQEFSGDSVIVLNEKKQIILTTKRFYSLTNNNEILGNSFISIMNKITHLPDDFFQEKSYFIKIEQNDTEKILEAHITQIKNSLGQITRYIIILKDISEHIEMQAQKDNFIATLTHDLKTPVRADILSLELLLKGHFGELKPEQMEIIQEILNSNKFMMNMLDTLLAKYKYENSGVVLTKSMFKLNEFTENVIKDLKCLFEEKNLTCTSEFSPIDEEICADKLELKRALSNIICNAIKFNKDNGRVNIKTFSDDNFVYIQVKDNGIGMSKDKLAHIFDKYVSYAKRFRKLGTGLGLYVAKKIINAHEGFIEVTSAYRQGSIFTIKLPKVVKK